MSKKDFIDQLRKLGYNAEEKPSTQFVIMDYQIDVGTRAGETIKLAFQVAEDFPLNPPGGPHVSPRLFPIHPAKDIPHPHGAVHESKDLGENWEYWSRPFPDWNQTDRTARTYMAYIRRLFVDI